MSRTDLEEAHEILAAVEGVRRQKRLSRHQLADSLGIPFETFRRWFHEKGASTPSAANLTKLEHFVNDSKRSYAEWDELWQKICKWWRTQHRYSSLQELAEDLGWPVKNLRACLENGAKPPRLVVERLSQLLNLTTPSEKPRKEEAVRRSDRLKVLLTILAEELAWFRDGPNEAREVYRSELDPFDTGYLSTLLTMLFEEDKFNRWLQVTTNRFNYFKRKGRLR